MIVEPYGPWGCNPCTSDSSVLLAEALADILRMDPEFGAMRRIARRGIEVSWRLRDGRAEMCLVSCRSLLVRQEILAACWVLPGVMEVRPRAATVRSVAVFGVAVTFDIAALRSSELDFIL